ncbi:MAG: hypothetical protein H6825_06340 [Planctomycetes bacterium]|nr:hypothetical protein [Planctomycetota bacterium]
MSPGRLLQAIGLAVVTVVFIRSLVVSDMTFEFGGLAVGAMVFVLGRYLDGPQEKA